MVDAPYPNGRFFPIFKLFLGIIAAVFPTIFTVPAGGAKAAEDFSPEQLQRLIEGDVIVGVNRAEGVARGTVEAVILIDAPVELIWRIMNDCDEIPTYVPGVEKCEVLDSGENWDSIRHEVKWIWLFPRLSYVFRANYQHNREISFERTSGDLREMKGRWQLLPIENSGTFVRYNVYLDPGFLIPQWLVRSALKSDLPAVLTALRNKVYDIQSGQEK